MGVGDHWKRDNQIHWIVQNTICFCKIDFRCYFSMEPRKNGRSCVTEPLSYTVNFAGLIVIMVTEVP
ncbi:hypothetical protein C5167_020775 [Papaver somniferum]|uniref:Uncharacterized protein n=1 Tax=Papaver somniferum TaxID=3469 RepID=A0A4Y7IXX6_PAPSO|nr:hypothetical protein C5167_020775 [Papaver somniferum]